MSYVYEGRIYERDPAIGTISGTLGPRPQIDDEWWYEGHPCDAYLANKSPLECSSIETHGAMCGACAGLMVKQLDLKIANSDPRRI